MTKLNDGGPAFPTLETETYHPQFGMSLRDYFAAQAMTGFLVGARSDGWAIPNDHQNKMLAANAYSTADAMLNERAKIIGFPATADEIAGAGGTK